MPPPSKKELDGRRILELYGKIDALLQRTTEVLVVGGAALAVHWYIKGTHSRGTVDIDVARTMSVFTDPRRTTFIVDAINTWLPPHLQQVLDEIAQRESLEEDWFNNKVVNTMPSEGVDYQPRMAYRGEKFGVYHPSLEILLAMKLKSSRLDKDLLDAARLADETGISRVRDLTALVEDTYGPEQITPRVEEFIDSTVDRYINLRLQQAGQPLDPRPLRGGGFA